VPSRPLGNFVSHCAFTVLCSFAKAGRMKFSFQTFVRHLQRTYGGRHWRQLTPLTSDEAELALRRFTVAHEGGDWVAIGRLSARGRPADLMINEPFLIYMSDYYV
jgi:hypothetical protein